MRKKGKIVALSLLTYVEGRRVKRYAKYDSSKDPVLIKAKEVLARLEDTNRKFQGTAMYESKTSYNK